jgi:hypothetical protein
MASAGLLDVPFIVLGPAKGSRAGHATRPASLDRMVAREIRLQRLPDSHRVMATKTGHYADAQRSVVESHGGVRVASPNEAARLLTANLRQPMIDHQQRGKP